MRRHALALVLVLGCGGEPQRAGEHAQEVRSDAVIESEPRLVAPPQRDATIAASDACRLVAPPDGFVDLRERLPGIEIVAGYQRADNFTGAPLPGYEAAGAWLDARAAADLARVAERLAHDDRGLVVYDAYRPRRASVAMVAWARAQGREDLLRDGWVAERSLHNRGVAIDVGLLRVSDRARVDMGSDWDHFGRRSLLHGVEGEPLRERERLRAAMVAEGFEPYAREWWHFTWRGGEHGAARDEPYRCEP